MLRDLAFEELKKTLGDRLLLGSMQELYFPHLGHPAMGHPEGRPGDPVPRIRGDQLLGGDAHRHDPVVETGGPPDGVCTGASSGWVSGMSEPVV